MTSVRTLIRREEQRQQLTLDLIPSENIASGRVREAMASVFMNKYAEGYPRKRYYPGNVVADELELTVQDLARKLYRLPKTKWHVNVQPYSGSPANAAIYLGLLKFGDRILGLNLTHGGHLTHGHRMSFSGRAYRAIHYGLNSRGRIDYDALDRLARKHRPKLIISGATAYPRAINFARIGRIARDVKAYHLADISHIAGLIAAKAHPTPFGHADVVMATTHKTLRGPRSAIIWCKPELALAIDKAVFPGLQGGPHLNQIAAVGVALQEALTPQFRKYQRAIVRNAKTLALSLVRSGFSLVSGGTDNHLMLVDMRTVGLDGSAAEERLEAAGIIANRNTVPDDPSPFRPSGVRLGTPSVTSRGMGRAEMRQIAQWIAALLIDGRSPRAVKREVVRLCKKFPIRR